MSERAKYTVGQWVCFIVQGDIRYGQIQYVKRGRTFPQDWEYTTTAGVVDEEEILEAR